MKTSYNYIIALALLTFFANLKNVQAEPYLIQPEDTIQIKVWRHPDLDAEITVGEDGTINLPLLGKIQAAQITAEGLEDRLAKLWAHDFLKNPYVSVSVLNKKFFVLGEVTNPGAYELTGNITILKALSMAGGLGDYASPSSIYILREEKNGDSQRIDIDVNDVRGGAAPDLQIHSGDIINIPQSIF